MGECEDAKQETESCFARNKPRNKKEERETKVQGSDKRENANEAEKSLSFAWNATVLVIFSSHSMCLPPCDEVACVVVAYQIAKNFMEFRLLWPIQMLDQFSHSVVI